VFQTPSLTRSCFGYFLVERHRFGFFNPVQSAFGAAAPVVDGKNKRPREKSTNNFKPAAPTRIPKTISIFVRVLETRNSRTKKHARIVQRYIITSPYSWTLFFPYNIYIYTDSEHVNIQLGAVNYVVSRKWILLSPRRRNDSKYRIRSSHITVVFTETRSLRLRFKPIDETEYRNS